MEHNVSDLTFRRLRYVNVIRNLQSFPTCKNWTASDWVCALTGELGEAANLIKKHHRDGILDREALERELADTLIYLDLLAAHYGISLDQAVKQKFNEVSDRIKSDIKL